MNFLFSFPIIKKISRGEILPFWCDDVETPTPWDLIEAISPVINQILHYHLLCRLLDLYNIVLNQSHIIIMF
jgi:hypothetical protein